MQEAIRKAGRDYIACSARAVVLCTIFLCISFDRQAMKSLPGNVYVGYISGSAEIIGVVSSLIHTRST